MRLGLCGLIVLVGCESADRPGEASRGIECAAVAASVRASYSDAQRETFARDPKTQRWFDTTTRVLEESCRADRWPEPVKQCAVNVKPGDSAALQRCDQAMPAELQQRLQARMTEAMQRLE